MYLWHSAQAFLTRCHRDNFRDASHHVSGFTKGASARYAHFNV